jgi:hypothetical protein
MMVYLLELQLSMWFVPEPFVGEMVNVMDTTHLGFCLEIYIYPSNVSMVGLDF